MKEIINVTHRGGGAHPYTWTVMRGSGKQGKSVTELTLILVRVKMRTKMGQVVMSTVMKM